MKRREFITLLGGAAAWRLLLSCDARAQERVRRLGFLLGFSEADQEAQSRIAGLRAGLQTLGWVDGQNLRIEYRWAGNDSNLILQQADELIGLNPDLIVAGHTLAAQHLKQTRIPTVFVGIADPVGSGLVESLARPGGNISGFTAFEYTIGGKWLSLLKELAPSTERVGLLFNIRAAPWAENFWQAFETSASSNGLKPIRMDVRDAEQIERDIDAFGREPNAGLIGVPEGTVTQYRELIIRMTAQHRIPAVYPYRYFPAEGGLASYGIDVVDMWRRAASYVDRILKGEKPADLPVQAPTKFEFVINLKTASALGLNIAPTLIASADEVIE